MTSAEKFYSDVAEKNDEKNLLNPLWVVENYGDRIEGHLVEAVTMIAYIMQDDKSGLLLVQHPTNRQEYFKFFAVGQPAETENVPANEVQTNEVQTDAGQVSEVQADKTQTKAQTKTEKAMGFVKNCVDKFRKSK